MISENTKTFIEKHFDGAEKKKALRRAEQLLLRGLTDENLIINIIKNEKKIPSKLAAEMYDKVNYMCRRWMDRMCRFEIDYDAVADKDILKKVILCLIESAPVLHSKFVDNHINPYWKVCDYHIDDVFSFVQTDNIERDAENFMLQEISFKNNVQIKISLFSDSVHSRLCFMFNHMCMDGGSLKMFLDDLFSGYEEYKKDKSVSVFYKQGTRSYKRVYDDFSKEDRKQAKKQFAAVSARDKHSLPFSAKSEGDTKMFLKKKIPKEIFEPARIKAKEIGATVNDLVSAAYIRAFYEISDCNPNEQVALSCAIDLRRHIKDLSDTSYTNHTTFIPCVVSSKGETMADTVRAVAESTKERKKDKFIGLHGLPLLNIGYSTMIYAQAELVVSALYNNANLAISNVGKLGDDLFAFDGNTPTSIYIGGGAKRKPTSMLNVLSHKGDLSLAMCIVGNENDKKMVQKFFDKIEENLKLL
ncbi:MAG: hypothetical protein J6L89_00455 [Clostridia bacterium]|nr:hypothetical protein [Clostridia bacterium]